MFEKYVLIPIINSLKEFSGRSSFCFNDSYYTYEDLAIAISKIRSEIQRSSFSGRSIGIIANDDIETYASIIAIWLEGYAYVPIHPQHPFERGRDIIRQAHIDLIIDSSEKPIFTSTQVIRSSQLSFQEMNLDVNHLDDRETSYILFTSGSTGEPKGVPITRGNLGAFMKAFWEIGFQIDENDRCLQCFDLTFDVSVQSFLVPLSKGACAYTIPNGQIKFSYAYGLLEDQRLTFSVMAPSMVRYFKPYFDEITLPDLRYCILTAEASPLDLVEEWSACIPDAEIYDFYGPTEATIYCTYSMFSRDNSNKEENGLFTIGKPLAGIHAIIVDEEGNLLPANRKGELCISGKQVTPGYWNNQEKNKVSFFEICMEGSSQRFYKTGDLCFIDNDGDIMYSGRLDFQVKIQGFRIELGEIEHHARVCVPDQNVIALAYESTSGNNEIALFIEGSFVDKTALLGKLKLKLPHYMLPSKIIQKEELPLNSNGKIDRNKLKKELSAK